MSQGEIVRLPALGLIARRSRRAATAAVETLIATATRRRIAPGSWR